MGGYNGNSNAYGGGNNNSYNGNQNNFSNSGTNANNNTSSGPSSKNSYGSSGSSGGGFGTQFGASSGGQNAAGNNFNAAQWQNQFGSGANQAQYTHSTIRSEVADGGLKFNKPKVLAYSSRSAAAAAAAAAQNNANANSMGMPGGQNSISQPLQNVTGNPDETTEFTEQDATMLQKVIGVSELNDAWRQGFFFGSLFFGLHQVAGGPCGVIASVNAFFVKKLFERNGISGSEQDQIGSNNFGSQNHEKIRSILCGQNLGYGPQAEAARKEILVDAVLDMLWNNAGDGKRCSFVIPKASAGDFSGPNSNIFRLDNVHSLMRDFEIHHFTSVENAKVALNGMGANKRYNFNSRSSVERKRS